MNISNSFWSSHNSTVNVNVVSCYKHPCRKRDRCTAWVLKAEIEGTGKFSNVEEWNLEITW